MHDLVRPAALILLGLAPSLARAQSAERPVLPFRGLAGEDGVHVLYTNPALMNYDRDPGYALLDPCNTDLAHEW